MVGGGHWRDDSRSCFVHGQAYRSSFFRGGGLGGRPRTPHDAPYWGRPSGAGGGRREKVRRNRYSTSQAYEHVRRFEELDSDIDEDQGVELGDEYDSDQLRFTGADLGRLRRTSRDSYTTSSDVSDISFTEDQEYEEDENNMQLAIRDKELRDKEEILYQKALARIQRAQELGKTNVRLSPQEIKVIERKSRKDTGSSKKPPKNDLRGSDRRRSGSLLALKDKPPTKKKSKGQVSKDDKDPPPSPRSSAPPGLLIQDREAPAFAPFGYYPEPGRSSRTSSRNASNSSLHQTSSRSSHQKRNSLTPSESTNYSPPLSRRQLPDDPNWAPRPRSASSNYGYPALPEQYVNPPSSHPYTAYAPPPLPVVPAQYYQPGPGGRRIISAPSEMGYPHLGSRRSMADPSPLQRHRSAEESGTTEESASEDDSSGEGVQVDVPVGYGHGERIEVRGSGRERNRDGRRRR